MSPLLLLAGKPVAGLLAGVTLFGYTARSVEVEAHEAEAARLRAEIEALAADQPEIERLRAEDADLRLDEETLRIARQQDKLLVPQEIEEAKKRLVVPEEARKEPDQRKQDPEP